jgi:hypothetical protein
MQTHPVHECALRVKQVELVVESGPGGSNGGRVGQHAERARDLGKVASGNERRGLVADTELESSRAPVDELDGTLGLDHADGGVGVLGDNVSTVQQAAGHVLALTGVALDHLVVGLEARNGHLGDRVVLVEGLVSRDDRCVSSERDVDTGDAGVSERLPGNTHGTKLVWNSFKSTLSEPSKRREAVIEDTT